MKQSRVVVLGIVVSWVLSSGIGLGAAWWTKRLTYNSGSSWSSAVALNGSNVYVVWNDDTPGNYEIYFKKSADGGASWQPAQRLTHTGAWSISPAIAVDGSSVYVVWGEYDAVSLRDDIYLKKSLNGGATWQAGIRLTYTTDDNYWPHIGVAVAASGSSLYVTWHDDTQGSKEIFFRKSADGGATWQAAKRLTYNSGSSEDPAISLMGSNVYVAWHDDTPGKDQIYFRRSADGGATWQPLKMLTTTSDWASGAAMGVSGSNIFVAWNDASLGNNEIHFRKSVDYGATWQAAKRLTFTSGNSRCPALAVKSSVVYVVWMDDTPGNDEIYFRRSGDGGATWQAAERLTYTGNTSEFPAIALNSSMVCVVWDDLTPGNSEIYFKTSSGSF